MSNLQLAKRACRLYNSDMVPKSVNRANQRAWLRSVQMLGPKWLLAVPLRINELKTERTSS